MYGKNVGTRNYRTDFKAAKNDYAQLKKNILMRKPKEIIEERKKFKKELWNHKVEFMKTNQDLDENLSRMKVL